MHTIRLLQSAIQIFEKKTLNIRVENRDELLNIKSGNRDCDELLNYADELIRKLDVLFENSTLQDAPNIEKAEKILFKIRERLY